MNLLWCKFPFQFTLKAFVCESLVMTNYHFFLLPAINIDASKQILYDIKVISYDNADYKLMSLIFFLQDFIY